MTKVKLYPFQRVGVDQIWHFNGRVLLCDEVGLGKTIQALTYYMEKKAWPCIVVCPAILKLQWQREAKHFYNIESIILEGRKPFANWITPPKFIIVNFEILEAWVPLLRSIKPQMLVIDEAQRIVNIQSKQSKQTAKLSRGIPNALILTGTPIVNYHWNLFPLLNILDPQKWNSPFDFGMRFCQADENMGRLVFKDSTNTGLLHKILKNSYLIRRTKDEVLKDLPPLRQAMLPFQIENRKEYEHAERDLIGWLASYDLEKAHRAARAMRFVKFSYLKRLAVKLKLNSVFEWIDNFLESGDGKLILGAWHRKTWPNTIDLIDKRYANSVSIHGGLTHDARNIAKDRFQNDKDVRIITLQLRSGGVGINLQGRKRTMGVVEYPWTPMDVAQFIGRGHRIGTLDPVDVWFFTAANTIEEKICEIITKKAKVQHATIDGGRGRNQMNLLDMLTIAMQKNKVPIRSKP